MNAHRGWHTASMACTAQASAVVALNNGPCPPASSSSTWRPLQLSAGLLLHPSPPTPGKKQAWRSVRPPLAPRTPPPWSDTWHTLPPQDGHQLLQQPPARQPRAAGKNDKNNFASLPNTSGPCGPSAAAAGRARGRAKGEAERGFGGKNNGTRPQN